jgi:hypothetical protein
MTDVRRHPALTVSALVVLVLVFAALARPAWGERGAQTETETFTYEESVLYHPCTGELIRLEGRVHFLVHFTYVVDGSTHFTSQVNGQGLRGIGETSGVSYVWNFASGSNFTIDDPYPLVVTVPFNSHVIAEGTEPDFRHHFLSHLTINENGEITSSVFESRTECE